MASEAHFVDGQLFQDMRVLAENMASRRQALRWLSTGVMAPLALTACGGGGGGGGSTSSSACSVIPSETNGPYPGDGTNSLNGSLVNALLLSGIVRSDITSSIVSSSTVATGLPLQVTLNLENSRASCAPLAGYAIYLWHCTQNGLYSMYSTGITGENYLRGVQVTDSNGSVTFQTIFPGCYSGRMPHIHFEVYASETLATSTPAGDGIKTSQIAFPIATCNAVYATSGYSASVSNLAAMSFATDNVFSDGYSTQLATMTGNTSSGYVATLNVGISV
jgi:protocatechuate 3,4-dioxygenase beta subunit